MTAVKSITGHAPLQSNLPTENHPYNLQVILFMVILVYPQKDHNGKRPQWKKSMRIKTTVYSKTA